LPGLAAGFGLGFLVDVAARAPYRLLQLACSDLQILVNK
jgi:hypothetical protein